MTDGDEEQARVKIFRVCRHIIDLVRKPRVSIENFKYKEDGQTLAFALKLDKNNLVKADPNTELPKGGGP